MITEMLQQSYAWVDGEQDRNSVNNKLQLLLTYHLRY